MFNRSLNTVIGFLLFVLLSHAPVAQGQGNPNQQRVTGTCAPGSSIRVINANGSVVCEVDDNSGGTVTSVGTGSGLTGGPITTSGTISVNPAQVQSRVTGTCASGSAIRVVDQAGTVTCQSVGSGTVTAVTASPPLASSGGTTPNISLPNVIIGSDTTAIGTNALVNNAAPSNTAIGASALFSNTSGTQNIASGVNALFFNTFGSFNTASGVNVLHHNTTGDRNTAIGASTLNNNTTGSNNTAIGVTALNLNTTGSKNTAIGQDANVSQGDLSNATAIGFGAIVNDSNKIRLGDTNVTVIEGQVDFTFTSDQTKKENFQPVDGEAVLEKLRGLNLTSWNYIGHDPKQFRHYGPMGQEFFAAFGHDGIGTIGTPTTLTSGDVAGILMSAVQAMEKRTVELRAEEERLKETVEKFRAENAELKARLERLERTTTSYAR